MFSRLPIVVIILFSVLLSPVSSQTAESPFVYYYSIDERAFIIERTDGTERSVLYETNLPDDYSVVGPGWSPSGKWLAWSAGAIFQGQVGNSREAFITSRDGDTFKIIDTPEASDFTSIKLAGWSPVADYLAVLGADYSTEDIADWLYIYDADNQEIIHTEEGVGLYSQVIWLANGNLLVDTSNVEDGTKLVRIFSTQGELISSFEGTLINIRLWSCFGCNEFVIYELENQLHVLDILRGQEYHLDFGLEELPEITFVEWSPDKAFALIYTSLDLFDMLQLWLFSTQTGQINLISEYAFPPTGESQFGYAIQHSPPSSWKPDSTQAVFVDTNHAVWLLDVSSGMTTRILPTRTDWYTRYIDWRAEALYIGRTSNIREGPRSKLFTFDGDKLEPVWLRNESFVEITVSPDTELLGIYDGSMTIYPIGTSLIDSFEIIRMVDREDPTDPDAGPFISEFLWHPSSDWLFVFSQYAGHYRVIRQVNVMSADGTTQRYLSVCHLDDTCFGWLPE